MLVLWHAVLTSPSAGDATALHGTIWEAPKHWKIIVALLDQDFLEHVHRELEGNQDLQGKL